MGWDIIGDIHGHVEALEALLTELGYARRNGAWRHPSRQAIFVGDYVDRGPGQLAVLELVRATVDAGSAVALMGNHELNAIAWATPDAEADGRYLRPRHGAKGHKNARQHAAFLQAVGCDSPLHREWVKWFSALPIWLEGDGLRVVHACWDPARVDALRPALDGGGRLRPGALPDVLRPGSTACGALDVLLKGPEIALPDGLTFTDKDGHVRDAVRLRWWAPQLTTYAQAYIGPDDVTIPDVPLPEGQPNLAPDLPTFFGHYWLNASAGIAPLTSKAACVDYSVAKGGPLVAYRYDGESELSAAKFVRAS